MGLVFADAEGATSAEDTVAKMARALLPVRPIARRFSTDIKSWAAKFEGTVHRIAILARYETRLKQGLDDRRYRVTMEIPAEAAMRNAINAEA